jgi:agmatine deiminase
MITRRQTVCGILAMTGTAMFSIPGFSSPTRSARSEGFFQPEESESHERTFMQWPVNRKVYSDSIFLEMLQNTIANVANTISEFEPVVMLMDKAYQPYARRLLSQNVEIWNIPTDDLWCRDSGPLFVVDGQGGLATSQINFNGWGNKQVHPNDGKIAKKVASRLGLKMFDNGLVGEAGGVESDGNGTLIAHESCWVNPNRNKAGRGQIETMLLDALGSDKIIWAPGVKGADITDCHIDALARFVEPGVVVIQMPESIDHKDPWSRSAFETYDILKSATDAQGKRLELITLPEPYETRVTTDNFVASYVNYYVCNGGVVLAQFGDQKTDNQVQDILADLYPDREIVALNIDPIGEVGGGIHCATQQQPWIG